MNTEYTFLLQQNNLNSAWHNLGPLHIFWATHKSRVFACYLGASFLSIKCCHSNVHDVFEFNILKYQVVMYTWTVSFIHQTRCSSNRISCLLGSHRNIKSGSSFFVEITAFLRYFFSLWISFITAVTIQYSTYFTKMNLVPHFTWFLLYVISYWLRFSKCH